MPLNALGATTMGYLSYDHSTVEIHVDDRTLAHLQIVIINKLRRHESFAFSWTEPVTAGSGRGTIWVHPATNLHFRFDGNRPPTINHTWLALLVESADSGHGLCITPEPLDHVAPDRPTAARRRKATLAGASR
jgi:hypothetical protein